LPAAPAARLAGLSQRTAAEVANTLVFRVGSSAGGAEDITHVYPP
jgi:hypothetical protein